MSGLVRVDFCDTVTGDLVGYGLVRYQDLVDCEGAVTSTMVREYFGLDDVSQGAGLPAGWEVCVPVSSGGGLSLVDVDGAALTSGDNVLRGMVFEDATPLDTDGLGNQVLELDCSMQKDGSNQIGVSANAHYYLPETILHNYNVSGVAPANGTTYNIPAGAIVTINNPCSDRAMKFMPVIGNYTVVTNPTLNTGYATSYISNVSVNGGAFGGANTVEHSQFTPAGAAINPPVPVASFQNRTYRARYRNDLIAIIPAGGSATYQANGVVTVTGRLGTPTIQYEHNMMISGYGWLV